MPGPGTQDPWVRSELLAWPPESNREQTRAESGEAGRAAQRRPLRWCCSQGRSSRPDLQPGHCIGPRTQIAGPGEGLASGVRRSPCPVAATAPHAGAAEAELPAPTRFARAARLPPAGLPGSVPAPPQTFAAPRQPISPRRGSLSPQTPWRGGLS